MESFLEKPNDYTIRLLNKTMPKPESIIHVLLRFDGNSQLWVVSVSARKRVTKFLETRANFEDAKALVVNEVWEYLQMGYKLTVMTTGYYIPRWVA